MPQTSVKEIMVAGPLANVSVAYRNTSYIADKVFPIIDKIAPKAKIARYLKGAWFRDDAGIRGPGSEANRSSFPVDLISVATKEYAFASPVTDEDRRFTAAQGAPPLRPDQDALEFCADKIDLKKERRVAALIKETAWSGQSAGGEDAGGLWAAGSGNTFIADVLARKTTIQNNTGLDPNVLIIDHGTYNSLKMEDTILSRIQYTQRGIVTADMIAAILELDEVLIGSAVYSDAEETAAGDDFNAVRIWELNATKGMGFLFYRPKKVGLKIPSAGYQARIAYENGLPRRSTTWREPSRHQDVYEVAEETDILTTGADLGFMWYDTLLT